MQIYQTKSQTTLSVVIAELTSEQDNSQTIIYDFFTYINYNY